MSGKRTKHLRLAENEPLEPILTNSDPLVTFVAILAVVLIAAACILASLGFYAG